MKSFFQKSLPHILAITLFLILSVVYFLPVVLENKDIEQGDIKNSIAWGQDSRDYHERTGDYSYWSNAMFSGMPANYTYAPPVTNIFGTIGKVLTLNHGGNFGLVFVYLLGFYIFLLAIGCKPMLAVVGAIAYAFCSYNLIIIEAGHISKGLVMATMAPMLGGIMLCYRGKYLLGALITLFFTGLNVAWNHQQISYYLLLIILILFIVYLIYAIKEKELAKFSKASVILLAVAVLAITPSLGKLIPTMDYTKETMRGGAVLKNNADGKQEKAGLDLDYAFQWSYGKMETFTLLIPNFYGGSSAYNLGEKSEFYKKLTETGNYSIAKQYSQHAPTYWGADEHKSFTSGPVYAGAIICFLFVLGLIIVKGKEKWWLLGGTLLSILLAWGGNAGGVIDFNFLGIQALHIHILIPNINVFLFNHLPLLNKFRTPEMALIMANLTMAILAILALKTILDDAKNVGAGRALPLQPIIISAGITGGICLFFALFGSSLFNFAAPSDANFPEWLVPSLIADRKAMLAGDAWRSFFLIAITAGLMIIFVKKKFEAKYLILAFGVLILFDMWSVDKRFLGEDKFVSKRQAKNFEKTQIDEMILQDKSHYRVLNLASNTFNESGTSAFHLSVGGYSPAKLRRYQDIIDFYLSDRQNIFTTVYSVQGDLSKVEPNNAIFNIIDMLNAKYLIYPTQDQNQPQIILENKNTFGNAWFVDSIKWVNSPDEEIAEIGKVNLKSTAVIDTVWQKYVTTTFPKFETLEKLDSKIALTDYKNAGNLIFESETESPQLAVFSEVYYKTWKAYIDGVETPLVRVNYILRGLQVPAGKHTIELKCYDELMAKSAKISLVSSIVVGVVLLGLLGLLIWRRRNTE
ncbi:MAG: hypothetical protein LBN95_07175 [Prevotellaceae bacterium]|jgi:hypothetical protein|nr:hypothetical protein [Prevotellaceae bacterium]